MAEKDRVLLINSDKQEMETLVESALEPSGYDVQATGDGGQGLSMVLENPPDVIVLDLGLQGLTGKDVIAGLNAQGLTVPIIALGDEGAEKDAVAAFRLGAKDFLTRPVREAELISAIERALKEVRLRRERETLAGELRQAVDALEERLQEMHTLMAIGKTVTSLTNLDQLFRRVVQAAVTLTKANAGGFLLRDDQGRELILRAGYDLSPALEAMIDKPVQDDLAQLVMNSQEPFLADGKGLQQFKPLDRESGAVIYAPLVIQGQSVGILWVSNARLPFKEHQKDLMTALADYAAIAIVNARLFAAMEQRSQRLEQLNQELQMRQAAAPSPEQAVVEPADALVIRQEAVNQFRAPLYDLRGDVNILRTGEAGPIPPGIQANVDVMHRKITELIELLDTIAPPAVQ